jgi:hypothetical protein
MIQMENCLKPVGFVVAALCCIAALGGTAADVSAKPKPTSATVVVVPSEFDTFIDRTGNIRVTFSDGHSETLSSDGNCTSPHVSPNGDVGWVRVDKSKVDFVAKNREGEDNVIVRFADGKRKEFTPNPAGRFVGDWDFADNGKSIVIQSSGYHGPRFYTKYELSTGTVTGEINQYIPYDELPSWAKNVSDERPGK